MRNGVIKAFKRPRHIKRSVGEHIFDIFNVVFLGVLALSMLYPFWYELALSLADADRVAISKVYLWPEFISWESYANVLSSKYIYYGYFWTIVRTVVGTLVALLLGFHFAYALRQEELPQPENVDGAADFHDVLLRRHGA